MVSDRVAEPIIAKGGEFAHGYTYSGHPAACAVALANLRIMQEEKLIDRVRDIVHWGRARNGSDGRGSDGAGGSAGAPPGLRDNFDAPVAATTFSWVAFAVSNCGSGMSGAWSRGR